MDRAATPRQIEMGVMPFARMAFFAAEDIPPLTELTWDYEMRAPIDADVAGRRLRCHCGADKCRGFLF